MERRWLKAWKDLPQANIQVWIEGIMANIKRVIKLEGGNEYKEGRNTKRAYRGLRKVGYLPYHQHRRQQDEQATMSIAAILNDDEADWDDAEDAADTADTTDIENTTIVSDSAV